MERACWAELPLKSARDLVENCVEPAADSLKPSDNRDCNKGDDQAVFDCRSAVVGP